LDGLVEAVRVKNLDRLSLVDRIGREPQGRMSYADIRSYLKACGVDTTKPTSGVNSKWVFTKDLLTDEPDERILRIADELQLPHTYAVTPSKETVEATFWEPHHFRLFLCHLATFKKTTAALQTALRRYGISGFVAHVDIEPTREWQDEIEAGLYSMDALAAILMPEFRESNWTQQEVGIAVGRGVLVVPIIRGLDPFGFIGKFQGFQAGGKTVSQVAEGVFHILAASAKTRPRMLTCLVDVTLQSPGHEEALEKLEAMESVSDLPAPYLERVRDGAATAGAFRAGAARERLNELLLKRGLQKVAGEATEAFARDDQVPF
jgi:hypothetical protein